MNKKILLSLAAGTFALLASSCSGDAVETLNNPIEPSASFNLYVGDELTQLPIEGATVTLKLTGKASPTKSNGIAELKDLYAGKHLVSVSAEGYAAVLGEIEIEGNANGNIYVAEKAAEEVYLRPSTAKLEGTLSYRSIKNEVLPAKGATVVLELNSYNGFEQTKYFTDVLADGKFVFENLPAVSSSSYKVTALGGELGGRQFGDKEVCSNMMWPSCPNLVQKATATIANVTYEEGSHSNFAFVGCNTSVLPAGAITCSFNGAIDGEKVIKSMVSVSQPANIAWNYAAGTVTITQPTDGAEWSGESVTVNFTSVPSTKGTTASSGTNIITVTRAAIADLTGKAVTGVARADEAAITAATETVALKWTLLEGATSYSVYSQCKDDRNAKLMDTYPASSYSGTTASQSVPVKVGQTWVETIPYESADDETSCSYSYGQYYCSDSYTYWDYCYDNSDEGDGSSYFCYTEADGYWSPGNLPIGAGEACKLTVRASNAKSVGAFSEAVTITTAAP